MDLYEIIAFIKRVRSDETFEYIVHCANVLDKYNYGYYIDEFNKIYSESIFVTDDDKVTLILNKAISILEKVIESHDIVLTDNLLISDAIEITNALYEIPYHEDRDTLYRIVESDLSNEDKLCNIIPMFTYKDETYYLNLFDMVGDGFINKIKSIIKVSDDVIQYEDENNKKKEIIKQYKLFKKLVKEGEEVYSDRFTKNIETIGLDFNLYYNRYLQDNIIDPTIPINNIYKKVSLDILGIALLGIDTYTAPQTNIMERVKYLFNDANKNGMILNEINSLITTMFKG